MEVMRVLAPFLIYCLDFMAIEGKYSSLYLLIVEWIPPVGIEQLSESHELLGSTHDEL